MSLALLLASSYSGAQGSIHVTSARWFEGGNSVDVSAAVSSACNGLPVCERNVNDMAFPQPSGNRVVKSLSVNYTCGTGPITANSREYLRFRLGCTAAPQPTALVDFRINRSPSCNPDSGTEYLTLPAGYSYCWKYEFDFSQAGNSSTTVTQTSNGIKVDWKVAPGGFPCPIMGGEGWMEKVFVVAGARDGEACPPHP